MQNIEIDCVTRKLSDGDFVVMVTDGVMGCAASGRTGSTDWQISVRTEQSESERMQLVLERVHESTGELPMDDMTVIVSESGKVANQRLPIFFHIA